MKAYLAYSLATGVWLLLLRWQPPFQTFRAGVRNYFLVLLGLLLAVFGLSWTLRHSGLGQYSSWYTLVFILGGLGTTVGAITKAPVYWEFASSWGFYAHMSERWRQIVLTGLGLVMFGGGVMVGIQFRHAYLECQQWYDQAPTAADSAATSTTVPDSSLRPPRGRYRHSEPAPMSCQDIVD
jgi:hypothetical protein